MSESLNKWHQVQEHVRRFTAQASIRAKKRSRFSKKYLDYAEVSPGVFEAVGETRFIDDLDPEQILDLAVSDGG